MKPTQFASSYAHTKLYRAYDKYPEIWKPAVFRYSWSKGVDNKLRESYFDNIKPRLIKATHPFDFNSCDWFLERRWKPAFRYVIHASCQFTSVANLILANIALPGSNWYHVADNDMNDGSTHHYVMNEKGHILDAQGLHLQFDIKDYQKTFKEEMISDTDEIYEHHECMQVDYENGFIDIE